MFVSFFPRPRPFFWSALLWTALAMAVWYGFASQFFATPEQPSGPTTFVTPSAFVAPSALWFDFYFAICVAIFAAAWMWFAPHPWAGWSILGSALILFASYFQVQISVALNTGWRGPFYNLIQTALTKPGS
ncbi:MAG TPA: SbmA/BacA-like family transporter, partial [Bradyrhizobium sp.]